LGLGEDVTCTFVNDDIAPSLTLIKLVINDNGGIAQPSDFTLTANGAGANDVIGIGPSVTSSAGLQAGTFALSESGPIAYTASAWSCVGGTQNGSNITLGVGQSATCTITNDDLPAVSMTPTDTTCQQAFDPNHELQTIGWNGKDGGTGNTTPGAFMAWTPFSTTSNNFTVEVNQETLNPHRFSVIDVKLYTSDCRNITQRKQVKITINNGNVTVQVSGAAAAATDNFIIHVKYSGLNGIPLPTSAYVFSTELNNTLIAMTTIYVVPGPEHVGPVVP
jgi:hypothetical protein